MNFQGVWNWFPWPSARPSLFIRKDPSNFVTGENKPANDVLFYSNAI